MTSASWDNIFGLTDPLPTQGRFAGYVKIPWASDHSSYGGFLPVPLAIVGGGSGPTVLLLGGIVGGEYDAQVAVARLVQSLDPKKMNGRVIAMTMANYPAALAGTRNSPLDGKYLNKAFPGDIFGTTTSIIAEYIERHLMSVSDFVIDLHSEARTMRYLSSATIIDDADRTVQMRRLALAKAFGAERILRFRSFDSRSTSGAARRTGATRIGVEISGADTVDQIISGIGRVLVWAGISGTPQATSKSSVLLAHRQQDFLYTLTEGVFQPAVSLGSQVAAGDLAGHVLDLTRPLSEPSQVVCSSDGIVVGTRSIGQVQRGDCVMLLATDGGDACQAELAEVSELRWFGLPSQRGAKVARKSNVRREKSAVS